MSFVEMSGERLISLLHEDEYQAEELTKAGLTRESRVRINLQGDIELLRDGEWEIIGGLIGDISQRIEAQTGLRWTE